MPSHSSGRTEPREWLAESHTHTRTDSAVVVVVDAVGGGIVREAK